MKRQFTAWFIALLLAVFLAGCGGSGGGAAPPAVTSGVWESSTWDSNATWGV